MNDEYLQYVNDRMIRQRADALKKSAPTSDAATPPLDPIQKMFRDARGHPVPPITTVDPKTVKDPIDRLFAEARSGDY